VPASPAGRLMGRRHFAHRILVTESRAEVKAQFTCEVYADRTKLCSGKAVKKLLTMCCQKSYIGCLFGDCFDIFHTKANYWEFFWAVILCSEVVDTNLNIGSNAANLRDP
jgi:hypothetical protein